MSRIILGACGALALLMLLTEALGVDPTEIGDARTRIKFAAWGSAEDFEIYREIFDRFERANPDLAVTPMYIPFGNYFTKLQLLFVGRVAPDVMLVSSPMAYQLRANGHIASLQPYVEAEREIYPAFLTNEDYYIDMLKPACAFDGAFYYLPIGPMSLHVYYNKTLFDEAGVPYPEEGWSWDDFREAARRLTLRRDGRTERFGVLVQNWPLWWRTFLLQNGTDIFDDDLNPQRCLIDAPEAVEAFEFLQTMIYEDHSSPTPSQAAQLGGDFLTGKLAMQIHGTWMVEQYRKVEDFAWDMAPLPVRKRASSVVTVAGVAMAADSPHPDAAWRFMRYFFSDEVQRYMSSACAIWQPTKRSLADDPYVHEVPGVPEHHHLRFDVLEEAVPGEVLRHPDAQEIMDTLAMAVEPIFLGKQSPAETLPEAAAKVNALLSRDGADR